MTKVTEKKASTLAELMAIKQKNLNELPKELLEFEDGRTVEVQKPSIRTIEIVMDLIEAEKDVNAYLVGECLVLLTETVLKEMGTDGIPCTKQAAVEKIFDKFEINFIANEIFERFKIGKSPIIPKGLSQPS